MQWKIYYSNSTYSDEDGPPASAPKRDVQAIVVRDDAISGRYIERSNDYYIWTPHNGGWRGVDMFGLFDYLSEPGTKIVLFGRTLMNEAFAKIWQRASKDQDLPAKSAFLPNERRPD